MEEKHIRYGGVRFVNNVEPEEINKFVRELPDEQRNSIFDVVKILDQQGLITVLDGDNTTIDKDLEEFMIPNGGDGE